MDSYGGPTASILPRKTTHLPSSSGIMGQELQEVEQQLQVLGLHRWRGTTLNQLSKLLRDHGDLTLNAYLYWLHENPIRWDLSRTTLYQSLIQSWWHRLRYRGFKEQQIYRAFKDWMFVQVRLDPAMDTNYKVLDEMISSYLRVQHDKSPITPGRF